ncbi:MAG: 50S ribosomal protein L10 [bacterium]|nr:50S ribosomal protein L10 [bacterium]
MAKTRAQKEKVIEEISQLVQSAKSMVFCDYYGLTVSEIEDLRRKLREKGSRLVVSSKTLFTRASEAAGIKINPKSFEGGFGIAFGLEDEVAPANVLYTFGKEHKALKIQGGVMGKDVVDVSYVTTLAQLPSRDELIAKAVGSIAAPISGFVRVLGGTVRSLLYTLNAIQQKKVS